MVYDGKNFGYVDKKGSYVINPQFNQALDFKNGLACVRQGDQWGYIDKTGKFIINPQFKQAQNFSSNGLALVRSGSDRDSKYGYIDKDGKYVINPQFGYASSFFGSFALAGTDRDKVGIIDAKGAYKANPQFSVPYRIDELAEYQMQIKEQLNAESDFFDKAPLSW